MEGCASGLDMTSDFEPWKAGIGGKRIRLLEAAIGKEKGGSWLERKK
jgi:hypothetical protein